MTEQKVNRIEVLGILKSPFAVSTEDGEVLFNFIKTYFDNNEIVELDFIDVQLIVSTFLNASIGQLYGLYPTAFIQEHLSIINMSSDDLRVLKKVTDTAKEYFNDQPGLEDLFKKHFPDAK